MKDAPSLEPEIIAKVSVGFNTRASRRANEVAAMGEPDRARLADNHPRPRALAGLFMEKRSRMRGAKGLAPSFSKIRPKIKIDKLKMNIINFCPMLQIILRRLLIAFGTNTEVSTDTGGSWVSIGCLTIENIMLFYLKCIKEQIFIESYYVTTIVLPSITTAWFPYLYENCLKNVVLPLTK